MTGDPFQKAHDGKRPQREQRIKKTQDLAKSRSLEGKPNVIVEKKKSTIVVQSRMLELEKVKEQAASAWLAAYNQQYQHTMNLEQKKYIWNQQLLEQVTAHKVAPLVKQTTTPKNQIQNAFNRRVRVESLDYSSISHRSANLAMSNSSINQVASGQGQCKNDESVGNVSAVAMSQLQLLQDFDPKIAKRNDEQPSFNQVTATSHNNSTARSTLNQQQLAQMASAFLSMQSPNHQQQQQQLYDVTNTERQSKQGYRGLAFSRKSTRSSLTAGQSSTGTGSKKSAVNSVSKQPNMPRASKTSSKQCSPVKQKNTTTAFYKATQHLITFGASSKKDTNCYGMR